jgi:hypothetical protein
MLPAGIWTIKAKALKGTDKVATLDWAERRH